MTRTREIVFIDPAVTDIPILIAGLRHGVLPVRLSGAKPALEEIADTLRGRSGLDAVHILVHGRPGELSFSSGALSLASIDQHSDDLVAIGDALGPDGDLLLWGCRTGEGEVGRSFVERIARATGAPVAAAKGRVGAAALGGTWQLDARSANTVVQPPLTDAGVSVYAAILDTFDITGSWAAGTTSGTYFILARLSGTITVIGSFVVPGGGFAGTYDVTVSLPAGTYTKATGTDGGTNTTESLNNTIGVFSSSFSSGRPGLTLSDAMHAARLAGAEEFIECMPNGYETHIEEGSPNLSGGQRQRLAIARALIHDPRILILDEATSALDPQSEAVLSANLQRIAHGRTMIIVSHRLASLIECDNILVMELGKVIDFAPHNVLLERCSIIGSCGRNRTGTLKATAIA
jgi:hypothetical protein